MPHDAIVKNLPPTAYLIGEVLAARWRTGAASWTLPSKVRPALMILQDHGLVTWKDGIQPYTCIAWLTDRGREAFLWDGYTIPTDPNEKRVTVESNPRQLRNRVSDDGEPLFGIEDWDSYGCEGAGHYLGTTLEPGTYRLVQVGEPHARRNHS